MSGKYNKLQVMMIFCLHDLWKSQWTKNKKSGMENEFSFWECEKVRSMNRDFLQKDFWPNLSGFLWVFSHFPEVFWIFLEFSSVENFYWWTYLIFNIIFMASWKFWRHPKKEKKKRKINIQMSFPQNFHQWKIIHICLKKEKSIFE